MSTAYMNAKTDLDWVQAPPQAHTYDKKQGRKNSNYASQGYSSNQYNNGSDSYNGGKAGKYSKKNRSRKQGNSKHGYSNKYSDSKNYNGYQSQFSQRSTQASDGTSPDRANPRSCLHFKVEVLGEVVINRIHPKLRKGRRRNNRFAAACELKAPEPTEIALPKFL